MIYPPWFESARAQSELFTFQCSQWELIWNSQLIGRYKEMSPGESYNQWPPQFETVRATEWTLCFSMQSMWAHLKQSTNWKTIKKCQKSELFAFQCSQWELFWNSQLIGRYKEMSPGESYNISPLVWNCQSTDWTLHFSMWSMRAHLKQSTNRKI